MGGVCRGVVVWGNVGFVGVWLKTVLGCVWEQVGKGGYVVDGVWWLVEMVGLGKMGVVVWGGV